MPLSPLVEPLQCLQSLCRLAPTTLLLCASLQRLDLCLGLLNLQQQLLHLVL